jgi:hypothetical protein
MGGPWPRSTSKALLALNDIMYKARGELEILREIRQSSDPCHPNIVEFLGAIARFPSDKESQDALCQEIWHNGAYARMRVHVSGARAWRNLPSGH